MTHNKKRLHKVKYFRELLSSNDEITESIRPLLQLSRDTVVRLQKTEYALVSSLERGPLLAERIKRLMTVPGVGPITALTWALEHELALVREKEIEKGNANRVTLAVARKMVAYLLAVDCEQRDFLPAEEHKSAAA